MYLKVLTHGHRVKIISLAAGGEYGYDQSGNFEVRTDQVRDYKRLLSVNDKPVLLEHPSMPDEDPRAFEGKGAEL